MFYSARNLSSFVHDPGLQVRLNLNQFTNEISREILKKKIRAQSVIWLFLAALDQVYSEK